MKRPPLVRWTKYESEDDTTMPRVEDRSTDRAQRAEAGEGGGVPATALKEAA